MKGITSAPFGATKDGETVLEFTLTNLMGSNVKILTYGATIRAIEVPDADGMMRDVCLGYRTLAEYEQNDGYFGATIGRFGNRIGGARFSLNGKEYPLAKNDGENHLHGGNRGFNAYVWDYAVKGDTLTLSRTSPDGEEGYPGTLRTSVRFKLDDRGALEILYYALCDMDTPLNLTNHTYFNLNGQEGGDIHGHILQMHASYYTPIVGMIPTGEIRATKGTPFDFKAPKEIGRDIEAPDEQLTQAGGYDHNFVLDGEGYREFAIARSRLSGINLTACTDMPGVQFYTGNFISGKARSKTDWPYRKRAGFCLETQRFPDAMAHENFPPAILKAGEEFHSVTTYCFSAR